MSAPTLINLPPPPSSESVTPSDMGPGTPNSTTTSLSALSTTAIKDGHQGHAPPHSHHHHHHHHHGSSASTTSNSTLEAERADRISRLAGLERVANHRHGGAANLAPSSNPMQAPGYFESQQQWRDRSTVGSASATGSVGGRTTWASSSDIYDPEKMSEDPDDGISSVGGFSDEGASLVGFGETASSTSGGPTASTPGARTPGAAPVRAGPSINLASPLAGKPSAIPGHLQQQQQQTPLSPQQQQQQQGGSPMAGVDSPASSNSTTTTTSAAEQRDNAKMIDGMTYDAGVVDTVTRTPPPTNATTQGEIAGAETSGMDTAESILKDKLSASPADPRHPLGSPDEQRGGAQGLGKFYFEEK
ncbi:hypothetical protein L228DRAFT_245672 [Xylona heveae TC161]|uniref:Uncharacterized protein n=1 Tax=Xylona heveae (strain CBS 132557 / TC161) TaxID=1328760 RepID=A0A165IBW7_XYLHT|nr:hypothetical protein L228DRAFT_245672 [Xylona heveae TC161]KZF24685.1 hypothetical protein L228DRAFT_245672 [Xylona heveae TC161]